MLVTQIVLEFLAQLSIGLFMVIVAKGIFEESVLLDKLNIILVLVGSIIKATGVLIYTKTNQPIWDYIGELAFVVLFVMFFRGDKRKRWKRVNAAISVYITAAEPVASYSMILTTVFNPQLLADNWIEDVRLANFINIYCTVISVIIIAYICFVLIRNGICLKYKLKEKVLMFAFEIMVLFIGFAIYDSYEYGIYQQIPVSYKYIIVIFVTLFFFGANLFLIKSKLSSYYKNGQKYQKEMLDLELKHFQQYKEAQEETKRFRHDVINNLMALQMLQSENKSVEAKAYVDELLGKVSDLSPKVVTGSDFLDCIITSKLETMEQLNIDFELDGVLDRGLDMSPVDMCAIFANAIDNAIEACNCVDGKRTFKMKLKRTASFYVITMDNSRNIETDMTDVLVNRRFTTKENKELHGYGLSNIKQTVARYGGETTIETDEDRFILTIMLPVS